MIRAAFVLFVLALSPAVVFGQPEDEASPTSEVEKGPAAAIQEAEERGAATSDVQERNEKRAKKKKKKPEKNRPIKISGRLFIRDTLSRTVADGAQWQNAYDVTSARVNVDYRKYGWLRAGIEAELSDSDLDLKDVFVRTKLSSDFSLMAGQFKRPISPIALSSIWDLPVIERGILAERVRTANYVVPLNLGGRAPGVMLTYRHRGSVRPQVDLGLFNARLPRRVSGGAELEDQADNLLRDVYLRTQIEPIDGFSVGATLVGFTQARFADDLRTRLLGSLDVTLDTKYFRAWLEGFAGRTPFFDGTESVGGLLALRVLAAGRIYEPMSGIARIEPYVGFSALDPTDEKQDNKAAEVSGGVTAFLRKNIRIQLEYARTLNENEYPQTNFTLLESNTIRFQLGVRVR